jgi:hypothetical protein
LRNQGWQGFPICGTRLQLDTGLAPPEAHMFLPTRVRPMVQRLLHVCKKKLLRVQIGFSKCRPVQFAKATEVLIHYVSSFESK